MRAPRFAGCVLVLLAFGLGVVASAGAEGRLYPLSLKTGTAQIIENTKRNSHQTDGVVDYAVKRCHSMDRYRVKCWTAYAFDDGTICTRYVRATRTRKYFRFRYYYQHCE